MYELVSAVDCAADRSEARRGVGLWALTGVATAVVIGRVVIAYLPLGPWSAHMAAHILTMNAAAPALALALIAWRRGSLPAFTSGKILGGAAALQMALLWIWHAPLVGAIGLRHPPLHMLMQVALLSAALAFWLSVLSEEGALRWRGIIAVLLTGKVFCLLGALLLFAPRLLYPDVSADHGHGASASLADQQAAGLMMLVVCPICYIAAGVAITVKWLRALDAASARAALAAAIPAHRG